MTLIPRSLSLALVVFSIFSGLLSAHASTAIKANIELPNLLDPGILHSDTGIPHRVAEAAESAGSPELVNGLETRPEHLVLGQLVVPSSSPAITNLDASASDSGKSTVASAHTHPDEFGAPQPGPEPYVMLLAGLGMIVFAITLHLKSSTSAISADHGVTTLNPP